MQHNNFKIPIIKSTKYQGNKRIELVEVHRDGKTFYQKREVGSSKDLKEFNKEEKKIEIDFKKKYYIPENLKKLSPELIEKYGDISYDEAFTQFSVEVSPVIISMARKWQGKFPVEDLINHSVGYMYARFYKYNPKISNPKTWTGVVIKNELFWYNKPDTLNTSEWNHIVRKVKILENEYYRENHQKIPISILSKKLKLSPERIEDVLQRAQSDISLDKAFSDEKANDLMLGDLITYEASEYDDPELSYEAAEVKIALDEALKTLTDDEREVLMLKNGVYDAEILNNVQIAKKLKTNSVQIRRIEVSALKKMSSFLKNKGIEKSIDDEKEDFILRYKKYIIELEEKMNKIDKNNEKEYLVETIKSLTTKVNEKIQSFQKSPQINYNNDIRIRQRNPKIFDKKTLRTINLTKSIKAVIGTLPNDSKLRIQTLIFNKNPEKGEVWNLSKAKEWTMLNKSKVKISVDVKDLLEKCSNKLEEIS